jgi:hypothetical protein
MPKKLSKASASAQASPVIAVREAKAEFAPSQRLVLYALASRLNSFDADVWPSIATIARDTSLSEKQARRVVHQLIELGILIEQNAERSTKTFKIMLPTPPMMGVSQGGREPSHGVRGTPPMVGVEDQSEDQSEAKDQVPLRSHETASLIERIHSTIVSDVDLAQIIPADTIDEIATEYAAHDGKIDALATIRDAGNYLRTEKGRTIRNGRDHLLRRLGWAINAAEKRTKPKELLKSPPVLTDFSTQPLPPARMIRVKF